MNGSSESRSNHVDGSSASHAVQLLRRSLSAQSSCLSLHPVTVPTSGSFYRTTRSSNPHKGKSFSFKGRTISTFQQYCCINDHSIHDVLSVPQIGAVQKLLFKTLQQLPFEVYYIFIMGVL